MNKLKNFPKSWKIVKHKEIATINPKLPFENIDEEIEVSFLPMRLVEEENNIIHLSEFRKYKEVKKGYTSFINGDIIFAKITPCMENGKCAVLHDLKNKIGFGSTEFHVSRPCKHINAKWIYYFIVQRNFRRNAIKHFTGSVGQKRVPTSFFNDFEIPLPPLPEQHSIVEKIEELFTDLDKGIETLKTAQQQLKVYRQAVLKWAFEGKLTNESNINWIKLGEVCENVEYGSATKSKEKGKIPVLRMGNIQKGRFDWSDLVYTSDENEIKKYLLKKDDILFNRTNSPEWVGKTAIFKGERPAIFAGYLIRINFKKNLVNPDYLNYFLNSHTARNYGNKVKSFGVNQSNINGTKLKTYPFPMTDFNSQTKIVSEIESRLSVCDKIEETITNSLKQSEALRQSILKKAFEGGLV